MSNMINFGIDLGTTNSLIAKFTKGTVEVFKNPVGNRELLPSVVLIKKDRIRIGDNAKDFLEKDPRDVFGGFKRKMGTSETFKVNSIGKSITPIELSAYVLKELKSFVHSGESVEHAVITIPASFDTIQSNATKEAGLQAGLKTVDLLQEPIAASLAYANKTKEKALKDGQWIVYDLGGGTFDVALVNIKNGEMKIVDHEGDNFLGGSDFDQLIVEKIVIPFLEKAGHFENLESAMKSADGKHNKSWYVALHKAEAAKVELSSKSSSDIEIQLTDDSGEEVDASIPFTRTEFEELIKPYVDKTAKMMQVILTRNALRPNDLQFILMVGGSTLIPYVRHYVAERMQINVNCDIDPTTAIAAGAAYYAGTKPVIEKIETKPTSPNSLIVKMAYPKTSQDGSEYFSAKITGDLKGKSYRITRDDSGFDTGLKPITERINEDLPLVSDSYNFFKFSVYDEKGNVVQTNAEVIGIAHGKYSIAGQPVPHDICIQIDDVDNNDTKLELVFAKNSILPLSKKITKIVTRTISVGSADEILHINVLEGNSDSLPESNWCIGSLEVSGQKIPRSVIKGADIEIMLSLSESRDLSVKAYIPMIDREFTEVFKPTQRVVPTAKLTEDVSKLCASIEENLRHAEETEDYLAVKALKEKEKTAQTLLIESQLLAANDVTDAKYQLDDKKRKLAQEIDDITKDKRIKIAKQTYSEEKERCIKVVEEDGNDHENHVLKEFIAQEQVFLASNSVSRIRDKTEYLRDLRLSILWRTPGFLVWLYKSLLEDQGKFNNQEQARIYIEAGKAAIKNEDFGKLAEVNNELVGLLPNRGKDIIKSFTGIA